MRWAKADSNVFMHSSRPRKVIWVNSEFANGSRKASAIGGGSETRSNRRLGRQRGATEYAYTNASCFQFLCCRRKNSFTLGPSGFAERFSSDCKTKRVDYAQFGCDEWIAR